jgi:esterase/lipase
MDWIFRRTLVSIVEHGAEIGECLYAASRINERDGESWIAEWATLAHRLEEQGKESRAGGHQVSARESFLRASTYYRAAEYLCRPSHPRFHDLWRKSQACFHRACPLFDPPIQILQIPFEDKYLPGYFWRPASDDRKRPTYVSVGGNDSSGEEVFFWDGFAAVRRGYNYFTFEYPGHRGTVHLFPELIKRPDYEVPFRAAFDYLETLPGVDDRIALAGYSHGGYTVSRVAIHEPRIKALIPSTPLVNGNKASFAVFGPVLRLIPPALIERLLNWKTRNSPATQSLIYYMLWTLGYSQISDLMEAVRAGDLAFDIEGEVQEITCDALALAGEGEGDELLRQTRQFHRSISSEDKMIKVFTLEEDASDDHCQLDNRSRANQVIFDWLDDTFDNRGYQPEHKMVSNSQERR